MVAVAPIGRYFRWTLQVDAAADGIDQLLGGIPMALEPIRICGCAGAGMRAGRLDYGAWQYYQRRYSRSS